jgi:hypothetical protein
MYFEVVCQAPTHAVLAKWLRDIHKIIININGSDDEYTYDINEEYYYDCHRANWYKTYEEAMETALQQALKLIP